MTLLISILEINNAQFILTTPSTIWIAKRNGDLEDDGLGNAYVDLRGIKVQSLG